MILAPSATGLTVAVDLRGLLEASADLPADIASAATGVGEHHVLIDRLSRALADDLPLISRDGGFIRDGYAPEFDELPPVAR